MKRGGEGSWNRISHPCVSGLLKRWQTWCHLSGNRALPSNFATEKTESYGCFPCIGEMELGTWRGGRYSWNRSTEGKKISLVSLHSTLLCVSMLTSNYISCLESLCKSLFISNYIFCLDSLSPWDRSLWTKLIFRIDTLCASPGVEYTWLTVGYLDLWSLEE